MTTITWSNRRESQITHIKVIVIMSFLILILGMVCMSSCFIYLVEHYVFLGETQSGNADRESYSGRFN